MSTRTTILAVVALAAVAAAPAAQARPVAKAATATWHPSMGAAGSYCVRSTHLETAAMTGTRIYQRVCRSERDWGTRGVTFARRAARG